MTYKNFDELIALEVYDALTNQTNRSFARYTQSRHLPRIKIPGELVFFLDELLALSQAKLHRGEAETFADVIDLGIVAWFNSLSAADQKKCGLGFLAERLSEQVDRLESAPKPEAMKEISTPDLTREREKNRQLEIEITDLRSLLQESKKAQTRLAAEIDQFKEELQNRQPSRLAESTAFREQIDMVMPAFLRGGSDSSTYTPLTTHGLKNTLSADSGAGKKNNKKYKR